MPACSTALLLAASLVVAQPDAISAMATNRPTTWAQPVALAGVPNLHKLSDTLYRSAQPTAEGMRNLQRVGIKTVVCLRSFHTDRDELAGTSLAYEQITMKAWHPERKEVLRFLTIVMDTNRTPVLVHCQHGADRTGTMCALYRAVLQGWGKQTALREMTDGGFGFHTVWQNLPPWIKALDIAALRHDLGTTAHAARTCTNGMPAGAAASAPASRETAN